MQVRLETEACFQTRNTPASILIEHVVEEGLVLGLEQPLGTYNAFSLVYQLGQCCKWTWR
jgi:hypothetical protein